MLKIIQILPVIFLGLPAFAFTQNANMVQEVMKNLYKNNGNKIILKPKVVITKDKENAALYLRAFNQIEISEKLVSLCRKYGKDSSAAMAFVLGHEFSHAFQLDLKATETSFLAYTSKENTSEHHEEEADISGGFMAYLSDYRTLDIIEPLIEDIYKEFNLNEKLNGYPTLQERKRTAAKVKKMINELIQVYELANYFTVMGKYELAINCYEYINKWYKGREIYNNIGVNYALQALNFSNRNVDQYIFPLELNWSTRIKKPSMSRGENLSPTELNLKLEYLSKSEINFIEASKIDPELFSAKLNIMTIYLIRGEYKEALEYYYDNELIKKNQLLDAEPKSKDQLRLALALAFEGNNEKGKSRKIWSEIANSSTPICKVQATHNLKIMDGEKIKISLEDCVEFKQAEKPVDNIKLNRWQSNEDPIILNEDEQITLSIINKPNSIMYSVKTPTERLNLQKVNGNWKVHTSNIKTVKSKLLISGGSVFHCESDRYIIKLDSKNNVTEYVKYN